MEPHIFELPRRVSVGRSVVAGIDHDFRQLGLSGRPLVLADDVTLKVAGERVARALSGWDPMTEVVGDATVDEADRVRDLSDGFSSIVSVGGGRTIDVGKVAAYNAGLPFVSVPTAPSHDGIASERASLVGRDGKASIRAAPPFCIIADIGVMMKAPQRLIASGSADAVSNLTALEDWRLAREKGEYYSPYTASLARFSADIVIASASQIRQRSERGIRNLVEALLTSSISMSMAGSSRPASGAEHAFSHVLEGMGSRALHGEQCGVGSILMAYLQGGDWKMIRDVLKELGAPTTARELGLTDDQVIDAMVKARDVRDRHTILHEKVLDPAGAREVARATGVI